MLPHHDLMMARNMYTINCEVCLLHMYTFVISVAVVVQYFESDDPDLWVSKVKYIMENDVTDLELVFAEEEFDAGGGNPRVSLHENALITLTTSYCNICTSSIAVEVLMQCTTAVHNHVVKSLHNP